MKRANMVSVYDRIIYLKGERPDKLGSLKAQTPACLKQKAKIALQEKIANNLRGRINNAKNLTNFNKCSKTKDLLGCEIDFFLKYLESKFEDWMSWENYGREIVNGERSWHIDHIDPCNTFNLTKEEEQRKCFHYTNLRPLCEQANLRRPKDGSDINSTPLEVEDPL